MMILYLTWDIFIVHMSLFGTTECLRKGFHNVQIVPRAEGGEKKALPSSSYPITLDASVRKFSSGSSIGLASEEDAEHLTILSLHHSSQPHDKEKHG